MGSEYKDYWRAELFPLRISWKCLPPEDAWYNVREFVCHDHIDRWWEQRSAEQGIEGKIFDDPIVFQVLTGVLCIHQDKREQQEVEHWNEVRKSFLESFPR